ncbi:MAG: hypothetical protein ACRYG8_43725 [Janthinobacterium lividum]
MYVISIVTETAPCPVGTFWSGSQPNIGELLAGVMAMLTCIGLGSLLATTLLNANLIPTGGAIALAARHRARLVCIIAPCALTTVFCWLDVTGSSYCLQPDAIRIRQAFSPERTIPWGDVTTVIGDCVEAKSGRYGILRLVLADQEKVGVSFKTLDTEAFAQTERSLSQIGYRYQLGQGLIAGRCPSDVAALLIGWSKTYNGRPM